MLDAVSSYLASLSSGVRGRSGELLQTLRMWNSLLVPPLTTELSAAYIWVWNWAEKAGSRGAVTILLMLELVWAACFWAWAETAENTACF